MEPSCFPTRTRIISFFTILQTAPQSLQLGEVIREGKRALTQILYLMREVVSSWQVRYMKSTMKIMPNVSSIIQAQDATIYLSRYRVKNPELNKAVTTRPNAKV
ncbi:hypothetical protein YC2023_002893 [Brassica napus]